MKITVHYPAEREAAQELKKRAAEVHCRAAIGYIDRLPCPLEQKEKILTQIMEETKKQLKPQ